MSIEESLLYFGCIVATGLFGSLFVSLVDKNAEKYADGIYKWFYRENKTGRNCNCIIFKIKHECRHVRKSQKAKHF